MNYKVIADEPALIAFIDNVLPDLQEDEKFYVCLFARKKYAPDVIKQDRAKLKRFVTSKKDLLSKIKQLEVEVGRYELDGVKCPQEALALYIMPNPRCIKKTCAYVAQHLVKEGFAGKYFNPVSLSLNAFQNPQCNSRNIFKDFDFDFVDIDGTLEKISKVINMDAVTAIKTRGGFHILVKLSAVQPQYKKSWYMGIASLDGCDMNSHGHKLNPEKSDELVDVLIPFVGAFQGNFIPFIYEPQN